MNIKFKVTGIEEVKAYIASLPRGVKIAAMTAASEFFIGDESHGLMWYPRERPKQKYVRTYTLRNSWEVRATNSQWDRVNITNPTPYAGYVVGDNDQAWMHAGRWRTVTKNMMDNLAGALQAAKRAVADWLKTK
jgi:hypothetical protein